MSAGGEQRPRKTNAAKRPPDAAAAKSTPKTASPGTSSPRTGEAASTSQAASAGELLYSDYINDRAIIDALRLPERPAGIPSERWPDLATHAAGAEWPTGGAWAHEEVLFIRTHQAFEVWFALALHEVHSVTAEAAALWRDATGEGPRRVELAERRIESEAFDRRRFPRLAAAVDLIGKRHGEDRGRKLRDFGAPGRLGDEPGLPLDEKTTATLAASLPRWTERLSRAKAALLSTLSFYDVLATMTPAQFLRFRDRLQPASGFGSGQFRELELLLGLREMHAGRMRPPPATGADGEARRDPAFPEPMLGPTPATPPFLAETCFARTLPQFMRERVARRWREASLRDVVYGLLATLSDREGARRLGMPVADAAAVDRFTATVVGNAIDDFQRGLRPGPLGPEVEERLAEHVRDVDAALAHRETIAAALVEMHGGHVDGSPLRAFLEAARGIDEAVLRWRDRHIRFVEGIIGIRRGTGGGGIKYLRTTVDVQRETYLTHALPALWQAKTFVHRTEGDAT